MKFDELNKLETSFVEWFKPIEISEKDKRKRIKLAEEFEETFLWLFYLMASTVVLESALIDDLTDRLINVLEHHVEVDEYYEKYLSTLASEIVNSTLVRIGNGADESSYWMSDERAFNISANEADAIYEREEFFTAIERGKKSKKWHCIKDGRERETHREVDGLEIPIHDAFIVGDSEMMFPKDKSMGASDREIVNCRCWLTYR